MKLNQAFIYTLLFLFSIGMTSCSQKLPIPQSNGQGGILVIAHKAINKTNEDAFGYNYIINYSPITTVEIKITPSKIQQFFIIKNFPVGKYRIRAVTSIGLREEFGPRAAILKAKNSYYGNSFEIKQNQVTLLKSKFIVTKKKIISTRGDWIQSWEFKSIDYNSKTDIINKLKTMKNSELWTFQE